MKAAVLFTVFLLSQFALANDRFPVNPDSDLTPGELCSRPSGYRYPEHIPYCDRKVDSSTKRAIIAQYDEELGYEIRTLPRNRFKIDHYIPLCMGGSNSRDNLWPQHESVFKITDELEQVLCEKMAAGHLSQARTIDLIKEAKNNLDKAPAIIAEAHRL